MAGDSITDFNHPSSRFTEDQVIEWVRQINKGKMIKEIAEESKCNRNTVSRLVKRVLNYGKD